MINLPPVTHTPTTRPSTTKKVARRVYATEPEKEQQKTFQKDRRATGNRRKQSRSQILERRTGQDRRRGRINVVI